MKTGQDGLRDVNGDPLSPIEWLQSGRSPERVVYAAGEVDQW
jgi:hypothetical protein